nr:hypothetical protein [Tanacetum cinerariifolium]
MTSEPALPHVSEALSPVHADLIPSPKRVRDISYLANVEVGPRETRVERVTHPEMPEDIPEPAQEGARSMSRMQREMRQMRQFRFYDQVRVGRLEAKMPNTRSKASMTLEEVEELVAHRVAEKMEAREAASNLETLNEDGCEQEGENGGNVEETKEMEMEIMEEIRMEETEEMEMEMDGIEKMGIVA